MLVAINKQVLLPPYFPCTMFPAALSKADHDPKITVLVVAQAMEVQAPTNSNKNPT